MELFHSLNRIMQVQVQLQEHCKTREIHFGPMNESTILAKCPEMVFQIEAEISPFPPD